MASQLLAQGTDAVIASASRRNPQISHDWLAYHQRNLIELCSAASGVRRIDTTSSPGIF